MVQRIGVSFTSILSRLFNRLGRRCRKHRFFPTPSSSLSIAPDLYSTKEIQKLAKRFSGKLLLRQEIPLDEKTFQKLLSHGYFTAYPGIQQGFIIQRCLRCNNEDPQLLRPFPCASCKKEHVYCRKCIMMGRVSLCEKLYVWSGPSYPWPKLPNSCLWQGKLRPLQEAGAKKVLEAVRRKERLLVWAVTGAGKTEILFPAIEKALEKGERICLASPRVDVVRELFPRFKSAFPNVEIEALYGGSEHLGGTSQIIIATTHQLLRFRSAFDLMIVDEIDAFPYHCDPMLPFVTERARKQRSAVIYLTATPRDSFKREIIQKRLPYCFIPLRYHGYPLPVPRLIADTRLNHSISSFVLSRKVIHWLTHRIQPRRQLLLFVPTISIAEGIVEAFASCLYKEKLIEAKEEVTFVHAEDIHREEKIEAFRRQHLYALVTTTILERGVTFPSVDVAVLQADHDIFDRSALVQIAGRAGRNRRDPKGEVVFFYQVKTEAIVGAVDEIKQMNRQGRKWKEAPLNR